MSPWYPLGQAIVVSGGTILVSHIANQVARDYLAVLVGLMGGLLLALAIRRLRDGWATRRVDTASVTYLIALSVVSLSLDWFDARGVIPAGVVEVVALLRPLRTSDDAPSDARGSIMVAANVATVLLLILTIGVLWLAYGPSPDQAL